MAAIQSVKSGNWSDPTVWSTGTIPGTADDVTINSGHTIVYDYTYDGTNTWINKIAAIYGTLYFSRSVSTQLVVASPTGIYVNGGTLDCGTESDPIPDTITHKIYAKCTSQGQMFLNDGATNTTITFCGSSSYYGNVRDSTLYADGDGTTTIKVTGDITGWRVGLELVIHKNVNYPDGGSWTTESILVTISSVGSYNGSYTALVVSSTVSSAFKAGGCVANLSRNIEIGRFDSLRGINQTSPYRPRILLNCTQYFSDVSFIGLYEYDVYTSTLAIIKNSVARNSTYPFWFTQFYKPNLLFDNNIMFSNSSGFNYQMLAQPEFIINNLLVIASTGGFVGIDLIVRNSKFIGSGICFGSPSNQFINSIRIEDSFINGCYALFSTADPKTASIKNCVITKCYTLAS